MDITKLKADEAIVVIVDVSVICHQITNRLTVDLEPPVLRSVVEAQLTWIKSGYWFNAELDWHFIWVLDSKPYWRDAYLRSPEVNAAIQAVNKKHKGEVAYKAGRKQPKPALLSVRRMVLEILEAWGEAVLGFQGYEADDIAAALTVIAPMYSGETYPTIMLLTNDSDWSGLVREGVTWFCSHGFTPRIRSVERFEHMQEWAIRRLGESIETPTDIWRIKTEKGDKSDNLPKGTPAEVIDLLNPPMEHCLWLRPDRYKTIAAALENTFSHSQVFYKQLRQAREVLQETGVRLAIQPWDPSYL